MSASPFFVTGSVTPQPVVQTVVQPVVQPVVPPTTQLVRAKKEKILTFREQQAANRKLKEKDRRVARKARKQLQVERRKLKRAAKAAPLNALKEWSIGVRTDAGHACEVCGAIIEPVMVDGVQKVTESGRLVFTVLHAHHILPKERYKSLKYERMNGLCCCPTCHKFGKFSAHRNPIWFTRWLMANRPDKFAWAVLHINDV